MISLGSSLLLFLTSTSIPLSIKNLATSSGYLEYIYVICKAVLPFLSLTNNIAGF